jgi:hypothetical protein
MKNYLRALLFFVFTFSLSTSPAEDFSSEHFKVAVGAQLQSLLQKRGMITYKGPQLVPVLAVQLFHPDWLLTGSALYYQKFLSAHWILRSRLNNNATADDPLLITSEEREDRVRREKTLEWDFYLEYRTSGQSFVRLQYSQDLMAHQGFFTELVARAALFDFFKKGAQGSLLQPGVFASVGAGNSAHNQYLYGAGADRFGLSTVEYGLWLGSPAVIDVFWPTLKVSHFQILGDGNRGASFVQERSGWEVSLLFAFAIF